LYSFIHFLHSSWTNRILAANDFGSVQINIANIDPNTGVSTKSYSTFALSGFIRGHGEADEALAQLVKRNDTKQ
jgi:small subunit ribosomal protein S21e